MFVVSDVGLLFLLLGEALLEVELGAFFLILPFEPSEFSLVIVLM